MGMTSGFYHDVEDAVTRRFRVVGDIDRSGWLGPTQGQAMVCRIRSLLPS